MKLATKRNRSTRPPVMKDHEEMEREMEMEAREQEEDDRLRAIDRFKSLPTEKQWGLLLQSLSKRTAPWSA